MARQITRLASLGTAALLALPAASVQAAVTATAAVTAVPIADKKAALAAAGPTMLLVGGIMALALVLAAIACALGSLRGDDDMLYVPHPQDRH